MSAQSQNGRPKSIQLYLIRAAIVLAIATVATFAFNEIIYLIQKEDTDRAPKTIQLVIPQGTAEKIAKGEAVTGIPDEMVFVVGDVLEVVNEDSAPHELGPIWVPPNSTGSLVMERADKLAYTCSFREDKYLGLDVRNPTTWATRLTGLVLTAPTLAALMFVYSLALWPIGGKKPASRTSKAQL
jgi:hypothetical protein